MRRGNRWAGRTYSRRALIRGGGIGIAGIAAAALVGCGGDDDAIVSPSTPAPTAPPAGTPGGGTPEPTPSPTPHPLGDVTLDPDLHVLVDKERGLGEDYVPPNLELIPADWMIPEPAFHGQYLRLEALEALAPMLEEARIDGADPRIRSAYRSYQVQVDTFAYHVQQRGEEEARRVSAPPGHSEHQLGTTIDFSSEAVGWQLTSEFDETPEGLWLFEHAHRFGFALSYPEDAEHITGYIYEPWHWRYIGREAAMAWHETGRAPLITFLEELHEHGEEGEAAG